MEIFSHLVLDEVLKLISSFELASDNKFQDQLFWRGTSSGRFALKSALSIIRYEDVLERETYWRQLWKVKAPQKMKVFAWLALQDRLMTKLTKARRGLTDNPFCAVCETD